MTRELEPQDLLDLARGAAFLGTGGGGDPYVGRLMVEQAVREGGVVTILDLADVADDAFVIPTAMMGAPTVMVEKLPRGDEAVAALRALEEVFDRRADATMPIECGGINSTMPLVVGATLGIPVVDADGMGRAFPELQMETFHVHGVSGTPMAIANERGDLVVVRTGDNLTMERYARAVTVQMGGAALIAEYAMDGATAKAASIPGTLSLGIGIGRCLREARAAHDDPVEALIEMLAGTLYRHARVIFEGKVTDVSRTTSGGFVRGRAVVEATGGASQLELTFQNEHLVARIDGKVAAIVPDLICVLDTDSAEPITTERIRYGQRVRVMGVSTPPIMRTAEALAVFGPAGFGLSEPFLPLETIWP
jgi:uncharacterized protein